MIPLEGKPVRPAPFVQSTTVATVVVVAFGDQTKLPDTDAPASMPLKLESPGMVVTTDEPVVTPDTVLRSSK